jgi:Protein of unknown function (DUF3866)
MPLSLRRGRVTAILEQHEGLLRLEVDGVPCVAYPRVTGAAEVGDDVLVNVQARELELGSGGFDIVHANLTRGLELEPAPEAHVMTLPYTSLQHAVPHVEEEDALAESLDGMPVVCCSVHSQVVPVCAALAGLRVAYVQLAGGALPVALSDALRALQARPLMELIVAAGPCVGDAAQAVNVYSALAWCGARGAAVTVCAIGPGIVGTGTALGHGGVAAAQAANAAAALGGRAVVAPRMSGAEPRTRHQGLSHHTEAVLRLCLAEPLLPDQSSGSDWREACGSLPLSHMGRGPDEDPEFFAAAFAAGSLARSLVA